MNKTVFGLIVEGDEMSPTLLDGDVVIVDSNTKPRTNGEDIAVIELEGGYHVCRLAKYGKQLILLHENGSTLVVRDYQAKIIGKVMRVSKNKNNHSAANTMVIN